MKIIGGLLCRNEEHRWLTKYLQQMETLCDELVVLDDKSTDKSADLCYMYGAKVHASPEFLFDSNESMLRNRLWNLCANSAKDRDWIVILDADELLSDPIFLKSMLISSENINYLGLHLYDMWSETHYRSDNLWNAHQRWWMMCARINKNHAYTFNENKLHCGRWPNEILKECAIEMHVTPGTCIKHMGWSTAEDRQRKYERYMKLDGEGKFGILEQYKSILDPSPNLIKL